MEHMYVHSVVVRMCWVTGCHIWIKCKLCIRELELSCTQSSCYRGFIAAKIFKTISYKKIKDKFLYEV